MSRSLADRGHVAATPQVITDQTIREVDPSLVVVRVWCRNDQPYESGVDFVACPDADTANRLIRYHEDRMGDIDGLFFGSHAFLLSDPSAEWRRWEDEVAEIEEWEEEIDI